MKMFRHLAVMAVFSLSVAGVNAQDFDKGLAAYEVLDYQGALKEWLPLAEKGDAAAQSMTAYMFYNGYGVKQDYEKAFKWNYLSAIQGRSASQGALGGLYEKGEGVLQSFIKAHMWYNISSKTSEPFWADLPRGNRNKIEAQMTPEDISKAQAMASECLSSGYANCGE